jgi:hypothetical protein
MVVLVPEETVLSAPANTTGRVFTVRVTGVLDALTQPEEVFLASA